MSRSHRIARGQGDQRISASLPAMETMESRTLLSLLSPIPISGSSGGIGVTAPVSTAPIVGTGVTIKTTAGQLFSGDVALVKVLRATLDVTKLQASINWGDGSAVTPGSFKTDATGIIHVQGSHTYAKPGAFPVLVKVWLPSPTGSTTNVGIIIRSAAMVQPAVYVIHAVAGQQFQGIVGKFNMPPLMTPISPTGSPVNYVLAAGIDWGDGGKSAGRVVADPAGGFDVLGAHTYQFPGQYKVHIVVTAGPPPGMMFPTMIIAKIDSLADVIAPPVTTLPTGT